MSVKPMSTQPILYMSSQMRMLRALKKTGLDFSKVGRLSLLCRTSRGEKHDGDMRVLCSSASHLRTLFKYLPVAVENVWVLLGCPPARSNKNNVKGKSLFTFVLRSISFGERGPGQESSRK